MNVRKVFHRFSSLLIAGFIVAGCQTASTTQDTRFPQRHALADSEYAVKAGSDIFILYLGADDCPPCVRFKHFDYPGWVASAKYKQTTYKELDFKTFKDTSEDRYWPQDLRWIRSEAFADRGAPRWIVLVDGKIVANLKNWDKTSALIKGIVARKQAAS